MSASPSPCPNCGGSMVMLRRERQAAGQRDVALEWIICVACRHVRLQQWAFTGEPAQDEDSQTFWSRA
jgi:hypothetical protein